jgi:hypothetical protein
MARSSKSCANDVFVKSRTYPPPMPSTASRKVLSGNNSLLTTRCSSTRPVVSVASRLCCFCQVDAPMPFSHFGTSDDGAQTLPAFDWGVVGVSVGCVAAGATGPALNSNPSRPSQPRQGADLEGSHGTRYRRSWLRPATREHQPNCALLQAEGPQRGASSSPCHFPNAMSCWLRVSPPTRRACATGPGRGGVSKRRRGRCGVRSGWRSSRQRPGRGWRSTLLPSSAGRRGSRSAAAWQSGRHLWRFRAG